MFKSGEDIANAALRLLAMTERSAKEGDDDGTASLEIGAAVLANHIPDWHYPDPKMKNIEKRKRFSAINQEWRLLNIIANDTKHCLMQMKVIGLKEVPWETYDAFLGPLLSKTLFVHVDKRHYDLPGAPEERGVHSLVYKLCRAYLEGERPSI